ncbi:hypothetical protein JCM1393_26600 [Clostridium carnis]
MQSINANDIKGIDVSEWQGDIDYSKVRGSGKKIVYIKATQGVNFVDPKLDSNYENAKAYGLLVGFYHFFIPSTENNALDQANNFVNSISNKISDCKLALDLEVTGGLNPYSVSYLASIFLDEVKRLTNLDVVLYTYTNFAINNITSILSKYPLWIAEYEVSTPNANPIWNSWIAFQYSNSGYVPGVNGNCDLDVFTKEILLNKNITIPDIKGYIDYINYTVQSGDTLGGIAEKFNTTYQTIAKINNILNPNYITVGEVLKIPFSTTTSKYYVVQPGDTLSGIAEKFNTTYEELAKINNISNPNLIFPGEVLKIRLSSSDTITNKTYVVQPGDTLSGIAISFNTTVNNLVRINNISNPNLIFPGEVLNV